MENKVSYTYCVICGGYRHINNFPKCFCENFMDHSINYNPPTITLYELYFVLPDDIRNREFARVINVRYPNKK